MAVGNSSWHRNGIDGLIYHFFDFFIGNCSNVRKSSFYCGFRLCSVKRFGRYRIGWGWTIDSQIPNQRVKKQGGIILDGAFHWSRWNCRGDCPVLYGKANCGPRYQMVSLWNRLHQYFRLAFAGDIIFSVHSRLGCAMALVIAGTRILRRVHNLFHVRI